MNLVKQCQLSQIHQQGPKHGLPWGQCVCTDPINDRGPADTPHKCQGPKLGCHVHWTPRNVRIYGEAAEGDEAPVAIFGQLVLQKVMPGQLQGVYAANQVDF
jgi:hypothetical protein